MELNYNIKAELDTSGGEAEPVWSDLGKTMTNLSMSLNEVLVQFSYLSDNGWGSSEVTGGQFTVTFTGHKVVGQQRGRNRCSGHRRRWKEYHFRGMQILEEPGRDQYFKRIREKVCLGRLESDRA